MGIDKFLKVVGFVFMNAPSLREKVLLLRFNKKNPTE